MGLTINIASFKHYLKGENFSVVIDHSALVYIINSKKEPPTLRLKKLLEILSKYSFNIRYLKGKEMYISDFLSRHPGNDTSSPNEIIPIAFIMKDFSEYIKEISPISNAFVMQTWSDYGEKRDQVCDPRNIEYEEIEPREEHFDKNERCTEIKSINTEACKVTKIESQNTLEECNITTRGMRQKTGDKPPAIWPLKGEHRKPEFQTVPNTPMATNPEISEIPEIVPEELPRPPETNHSNPIPVLTNPNPPMTTKPLRQELPRPPDSVPFRPPDPVPFRHPERPVRNEPFVMPPRQMPTEPELPNIMDPNFRPNINPQPQAVIDISKKHPIDVRFQGYLPQFNNNSKPSIEIRPPDKQMYNDKQKLLENIKDENIFRKHLPKQAELDKYMEKLKKKIINNYELPLTTKELIPEQKRSPFFKDIYKYVTSGRIPSDVTGKAARNLQKECENY